ncbi:MAG: TonB-dependent receptor plug domain-containing protein [Gemmatimonadaceae bacterium]|nr:TonB-dependent receptor plug domain-containing protein [Gemmatimonadaceae bacterium]
MSTFSVTAMAQETAPVRLDTVVVTVDRGPGRSVLTSPFALSVVRPDSSRPGQRHTSIDESLTLVPGLLAVNRNNPAQDPRISIRGFGARSAFGVRGVRVLRDGMPRAGGITSPRRGATRTWESRFAPSGSDELRRTRGLSQALRGT